MDIRPIKTDVDYKSALKEIESLFDAKPNIAEGVEKFLFSADIRILG